MSKSGFWTLYQSPDSGSFIKGAVLTSAMRMSDQSEIHVLRQDLGAARQPPYASKLSTLQNLLEDLNLEHPYSLTGQQRQTMMLDKSFALNGGGLNAAYQGEFVYRLSGVRKVVDYTEWQKPYKYYSDDDIWLRLKNDFDAVGWLPLRDYAAGKLSGPRTFTWWGDEDFLSADIICGAHRSGLPNDWIAKYSLLLRYPTEKLAPDSFLVPSVLHAFDGEIFHPTADRDSPTEGRAIDLDSTGPLTLGAREFVLLDLDVNNITFQPILIDSTLRRVHVLPLNSLLRSRLRAYYGGLEVVR
jgi:hypothetical protein